MALDGFLFEKRVVGAEGGPGGRRVLFKEMRSGWILDEIVAWRQKTNAVCPSGKWSEAMNRMSGMKKFPVI